MPPIAVDRHSRPSKLKWAASPSTPAAKVAAERASADNIVRAEVLDESTAPEDRRIPEPDDEAT
jgi:hypothetical protein